MNIYTYMYIYIYIHIHCIYTYLCIYTCTYVCMMCLCISWYFCQIHSNQFQFKSIFLRQLSQPIQSSPPPFAHVAGSSYAPAVGQPRPAPQSVQLPNQEETNIKNWWTTYENWWQLVDFCSVSALCLAKKCEQLIWKQDFQVLSGAWLDPNCRPMGVACAEASSMSTTWLT